MPDATYPLMRRSRRRRRWRPARLLGPRVRALVLLAGALALVMAGVLHLRRPGPVDPAAALGTGEANYARGNYHAARANAQAAADAAPRSAAARLLLARAGLRLGNGAAAEAELARARALGTPAAAAAALHAEARLLQGDAVGAAAELADAADPLGVRVRARALAVGGSRAAALATLAGLVAAHPDDADAWTDLGRIRFSGGDVGGADAAAARALALRQEPEDLTLKAELVRARFGPVASLPWFEAALAHDAYHYPALIGYAATLGDAGRAADMLAATRRALVSRPDGSDAYYLQAVLAARAGRTELARGLLARAGDALPGARLLDGAMSYAGGDWAQAAELWRALVRRQPMNVAVRRLLGAALLRAGDPRGALDALSPLVPRADADAYALTLAARASEAVGDRGAAATLLDRAARGRGPSGVFLSDRPASVLALAAANAPTDPTYALGLIRGLLSAGDSRAAAAAAARLARQAPGAAAAQTALGDALAAANRWPEAAAAFARAADLRFDEPAMLRLVDAYGRVRRPERAAAALSLYLSQNPQSRIARRLLGRWQVAVGRWDDAVETLEALRVDGGARDAGLLADLALAHAGGGDGAVARRYAAAAYALMPMSAPVVAAYARALDADGDADGARQLRDKLARLG